MLVGVLACGERDHKFKITCIKRNFLPFGSEGEAGSNLLHSLGGKRKHTRCLKLVCLLAVDEYAS